MTYNYQNTKYTEKKNSKSYKGKRPKDQETCEGRPIRVIPKFSMPFCPVSKHLKEKV